LMPFPSGYFKAALPLMRFLSFKERDFAIVKFDRFG